MKKSPYILGLNALGFNTSASLLKNNEIVGALEEERLIREKRTRKFPINSIKYLLNKEKISFEDLGAIAISWNPGINLEKFDYKKSDNLSYIPDLLHSIPNFIISNLKNIDQDYFKQEIKIGQKKLPIYYIKHHICHSANYYLSPFNSSSTLTVDAFGEKQSTGFFRCSKNIKELKSQEFPHSLGSFYSTFTEFCGFKPQSDEWKLMGASAYGDESKYYKKIRDLVFLIPEGGFELNLKYFNYYQFHRPNYYNSNLSNYLSLKPNFNTNLNTNYYDLCASVQKVFEDIYFHLINSLYKINKNKNLVISGGCALNCVANGKILQKTKFKRIFIPPMPDDSGAGLGAACYVYRDIFKKRKKINFKNNFLGPNYSNKIIKNIFDKYKLSYKFLKNPSIEAATSIANGKIIGWFQDSLEFGDRALGNRSILADPRKKNMKLRVNKTIKYREKFRPFAPAVHFDKGFKYFENYQDSYFMEKTLKVKKAYQKKIPAVTHEDGSGRLQTVKKENSKFYNLIEEFYNITGIPIILNTSLNYKGDSMVCSPEDAIKTFFLSGLDEIFIENYKLSKNDIKR